jgi:hypothetical protein
MRPASPLYQSGGEGILGRSLAALNQSLAQDKGAPPKRGWRQRLTFSGVVLTPWPLARRLRRAFPEPQLAGSMGDPMRVHSLSAMVAVPLHAAQDVVQDGAEDRDERPAAGHQAPGRTQAGQGEREPSDEGDNGGDEDRHDERPRRGTAFGAQFHGFDPYTSWV